MTERQAAEILAELAQIRVHLDCVIQQQRAHGEAIAMLQTLLSRLHCQRPVFS